MEERLQKIMARAGVASRRSAEKMILEGRVSINGKRVATLGTKADPAKDDIRVDDRLISCEQTKLYLALNKPRGYVTTLHDPQKRSTVADLMAGVGERVYPVGRLDYDSEGLLIMTNDGDFSHRIQHPRFEIPKTYRVKIKGRLSPRHRRMMETGIELDDGPFKPLCLDVEKENNKSCWLKIKISEGRNRIIRRAFESLGYSVARLIRVSISSVNLEGIKEGEYRNLSAREVASLIMAASGKHV